MAELSGAEIRQRFRGTTEDAPEDTPSEGAKIRDLFRVNAPAPVPETPAAPAVPSLSDAISSPDALSADVPQSQTPGPPVTQKNILDMLAPAPNTTYGSVLPLARDNTTGDIRWALPNLLREPLQVAAKGGADLLAGPGGMVMGPHGPMLTPEATMALTMVPGAMPGLRLGGAPEAVPTALAAREAPLSPEFKANPLSPDYAGPSVPPGPTSPAGIPLPPPEAVIPPPAAAPTTMARPTTADEAKKVASTWYKQHEQAGGAQLPANFANEFIDTVKRTAPQTEEGLAIAGETPVTQLIQRAEALRDKPISLAGAQEIDEALGTLIDKEFGVKGLSKEGTQLLDLQTSFREQLENAAPGGDAGAAGGVDALKQGRKAWSQAMKMRDLERIQLRASQTEQPSTEIRRGIRTLLGNEKRSRGYSDEEREALLRASSRGALGEVLHTFGSRLVPYAIGAGGFASGGVPGLMASAALGHYGSQWSRAGATALQNRRLGNALSVLGDSVPLPSILSPPP